MTYSNMEMNIVIYGFHLKITSSRHEDGVTIGMFRRATGISRRFQFIHTYVYDSVVNYLFQYFNELRFKLWYIIGRYFYSTQCLYC